MTAIEPLVPLPEEPLLPATVEPARGYRRSMVAMPMVRVNLLPGEVVASRRGHRMRRIVLVALVVLVLVLAAVSFFVRSGIGDARGQLAAADAVNTNLISQQSRYAEVVTAQSDLKSALQRLGTLTATDVGWADVTRVIRSAAPAGITFSGVTGTAAVDSGTAGSVGGAPGGAGTPSGAPADAGAAGAATGAAGPPATVVITGYSVDPKAVADYVDALAKSTSLANVVATGVSLVEGGQYSFGIAADVTPTALSHRFDTSPAGGK